MDRLCRICLASEAGEVFKDFFTPNKEYAQKLFFLANITVFEVSNKLPALICNRCTDNLTRACRLKKLALETDNFFKQITDTDDINILKHVMKGVDHKFKIEKQIVATEEDPEYTIEEMIDFSLMDVKVEALEEENGMLIEVLDDPEDTFMHKSLVHNTEDTLLQDSDDLEYVEVKKKRIHKNLKVHKCKYCIKAFHRPSLLRKHIEIHHEGNIKVKKDDDTFNSFKEDEDSTFMNEPSDFDYVDEIKEKKSKKVKYHPCTFENCPRIFPRPSSLLKHLETHKEGYVKKEIEKLHKCDIEGCTRAFPKPYLLQKHLECHERGTVKVARPDEDIIKEIYECDFEGCGKSFCKAFLLRNHKEDHEPETIYNCGFVGCNLTFNRKYLLEKHMRTHNCEKNNISSLQLDFRPRHGDKKIYVCEVQGCGRTFLRPYQLREHIEFHTGERNHKCELCGGTFFTSSHLRGHIRDVHTIKPYYCDLCGRICKNKSCLYSHIVFFHLKKPKNRAAVCHLCGKTVSSKKMVEVHMLYSHGGERNFKCEICDKAFFTSSRLRQHIATAHGERNWVCEICSKTFSHRYKLGEHMKQVHKTVLNAVKRYDCTLCGASFDRTKNLNHHLSEKHQVVIDDDEENN